LEAVEREIDKEYQRYYLAGLTFPEAAWYFLAFCEERQFKAVEIDRISGRQDFVCFVDEIVNSMKTPLRWLWRTCKPGAQVPRRYSSKCYQASWDFTRLASEYDHFELAYVYARAGANEINLVGDTIVPTAPFGKDTRFEAYDRLYFEPTGGQQGEGVRFLRDVAKTVTVAGEHFCYKIDPTIMARGIEELSPTLDAQFWLPSSWALPRYSFGEFLAIASTLRVRALIHYVARVEAARRGCVGMGYADSVLVLDKTRLMNRLKKYTGLDERVIAAIARDMTFGEHGVKNPDPALQPLISLTPRLVAIPPALFIGINIERNLTVLLNRFPDEKETYSRLSTERESLSRQRVMTQLKPLGFRFWSGQIAGRRDLPDVDLAIIDDREFTCLVLELKAFVQPAEPREIREKSEEIEHGVGQANKLRVAWQLSPDIITVPLKIDDRYSLCFAVASETFVGTQDVQSESIPVIRTSHLVRRMLAGTSLSEVCCWLSTREYLPVEGRHYEISDIVARVGSWNVQWYKIKPLIPGEYL
jgi:hypothetical protein